MPDFEITLTCTQAIVDGQGPQTWQKSTIIENTTRALAIPLGIDDLIKWSKDALCADFKPLPGKAIEYWEEARRSGNLQFYEIQSMLDSTWGISFGITEVSTQMPASKPEPRRNGRPAAFANGVLPELPDLHSMLQNHLRLLQGRQETLASELSRKQMEFERIGSEVLQIEQMLLAMKSIPSGQVKRRRFRKPKETDHADA